MVNKINIYTYSPESRIDSLEMSVQLGLVGKGFGADNQFIRNTLADDGSEFNVDLSFEDMKDFSPEQVAKKIPQLRSLLAMRNLLRDLKSNLLDNATFRYELEKIVKNEQLMDELRAELESIVSESEK